MNLQQCMTKTSLLHVQSAIDRGTKRLGRRIQNKSYQAQQQQMNPILHECSSSSALSSGFGGRSKKCDELFRTKAIGLAIMITSWVVTAEGSDNEDDNLRKNIQTMVTSSQNIPHHHSQSVFATSAIKPSTNDKDDSLHGRKSIFLSKGALPSQEFDFIVIGYGNAGSKAVQTLKSKCPQASILVIDPSSSQMMEEIQMRNNHSSKSRNKNNETEFFIGSAIGYDHANQTVDIFSSQQQQRQQQRPTEYQSVQRIKYKHSLLVASGVRGSPPPEALIDSRVTDRILELRSTQLPSLNQYYIENGMSNLIQSRYPVISRSTVRQIALMASSQGSKVCILGSGIEAIDLAAAVAAIQRRNDNNSNYTKSKKNGQQNGSIGKEENSVSLIFGAAAPLSNIVPRYLSSAVSKQLRSHGVDVEERSAVRYISKSQRSQTGAVEIHMVKSFDNLDSKRCEADLLILAPSINGQQGTAVIPTIKEGTNSIPKLSFQPWSKLGVQKAITSYSDDGRIVVNSELNAASNIYAAGSVAKYPNHFTGHATVAGEGASDGALAGNIAAANMAKQYHKLTSKKVITDGEIKEVDNGTFSISQEETLPIMRTDKLSASDDDYSALSSLGISALCVGQCDSENMSTHGFWWTNQVSRRMTRRSSNNSQSRKERNSSERSVFGKGIVFYLDRSASIRGIMVWGIPFTSKGKDKNDLNKDLIDRIESIIRSNGKVIKTTHKSTIEGLSLDPYLLSQTHLMEESKLLASIAYSALSKNDSMNVISNSRPLHRYIPSKPISVSSMGVLKRGKAIGNGGVGDDIFERSASEKGVDETLRHPSLVHFFSYDWSTSQPIQSREENNEDDLETAENEATSRPPKEESLWLRRNEIMKTTSLNDKMAQMFEYNLKRGQFSDGNDAVKQAPIPDFVENTREELQRWMGNNIKGQDREGIEDQDHNEE